MHCGEGCWHVRQATTSPACNMLRCDINSGHGLRDLIHFAAVDETKLPMNNYHNHQQQHKHHRDHNNGSTHTLSLLLFFAFSATLGASGSVVIFTPDSRFGPELQLHALLRSLRLPSSFLDTPDSSTISSEETPEAAVASEESPNRCGGQTTGAVIDKVTNRDLDLVAPGVSK